MKQNSTIPKLTAIMPVYIQTIFIRCVMRSLLAQTFKEWELHTVVAGRMLGISIEGIETMAEKHVHIHVYGDVFQSVARKQLDEVLALCPDYVHLHPNCPSEKWVNEFSRYDAGWLHYFECHNGGDLLRADWIDISSPACMSTYGMAGLPMLMHDNMGHIVHHQRYLEKLGMAIPVNTFANVGKAFADKAKIETIRQATWNNRLAFSFDSYAEELIAFFRKMINKNK